jgi:hypothetical protein
LNKKPKKEEEQEEEGEKPQKVTQTKSIFHGKMLKDYLGRTFVDHPSELKPAEHECFLPKKIIHTWCLVLAKPALTALGRVIQKECKLSDFFRSMVTFSYQQAWIQLARYCLHFRKVLINTRFGMCTMTENVCAHTWVIQRLSGIFVLATMAEDF